MYMIAKLLGADQLCYCRVYLLITLDLGTPPWSGESLGHLLWCTCQATASPELHQTQVPRR